MTVKEFIACTNYFKKHNNIRARLFIKFLKKEKQAYLLLNAKLPCYKLCADYYIDELWSLKQRHAMKEILSRLESSWHIFLWSHLEEQRKYARVSHRSKTKRKLNGTAN